jgi:hypothetical protein
MRAVAVRLLAALCALTWLILPGFGLIDLSVTWSSDWPEVLEAGWGLFFTVLVASSFVLVLVRLRGSIPGTPQLAVVTLCLAAATVAAEEWRLGLFTALVAIEAAAVGVLARPSWTWRPTGRSLPVLVLGAAGVVPWVMYALEMWSRNREHRADSDHSVGIDHYSVQGALGLALALLPVAAGLRRELGPFVPVCAGVCAAYLGLVSVAWQDAAGRLGTVWSVLAILWGVGLAGAAVVGRDRLPAVHGLPAAPGPGLAESGDA